MKVGIDLGGTKTEGILIDDTGKELARNRIKTEKNYDGTIGGIISIVKNFETDFGDSRIRRNRNARLCFYRLCFGKEC
jgi:fructokinase